MTRTTFLAHLLDTLTEALGDARHYATIGEPDKLKDALTVAEKCLEALRVMLTVKEKNNVPKTQ